MGDQGGGVDGGEAAGALRFVAGSDMAQGTAEPRDSGVHNRHGVPAARSGGVVERILPERRLDPLTPLAGVCMFDTHR